MVELLGAPGGFCQLLYPGIDLRIELNRRGHGRDGVVVSG
jgi:hypothetical protein